MNENLTITEVLKVFDGDFIPGRAKGQPCRHSDAFVYFLCGEIEYTFSDCSFTAKEKNIVFLPKGSAYGINVLTPAKYMCVDFNTESGQPIKNGELYKNLSPDLANVFSKLLKTWSIKNPWYIPSLFSGVYRIYAEVLKSQNAKYRKSNPIFSHIADYVLANYVNPDFSVSKLSDFFGVSEVHLRRIFKSEVNSSPIKYINYLRLEKAKNMLLTSNLTVQEIAEAAGFSDPYYFSRIFKKETGMSPVSFRKNNF